MFFKQNRSRRVKSAPLVLDRAPSVGLFDGTMIGCPNRWAPVESLRVGDEVLTANGGPQRIAAIDNGTLKVSAAKAVAGQWPLMIPEGAIFNDSAMLVAPDTRLVLESEIASEMFGHACVSVAAKSLIGFRGIARARTHKRLHHVTLRLETPQTLVGQGNVFFDLPGATGSYLFPKLSDKQARLLTRYMGEDQKPIRSGALSPAWI